MPRIPQNFIDDLLARIDIAELISARITLKKTGVNYKALCPFHNEKTPSFTVNPRKQMFYCFGCGEGGNAISFIMRYDRLSFPETVETLAAKVGLEVPTHTSQQHKSYQHLYPLLDNIHYFYFQQLKQNKNAVAYLKNRELTGNIAKQFGLGYAPVGWDNLLNAFPQNTQDLFTTGMLIKNQNGRIYDRFRDRIMFPIRDTRGRVIGFGGRILDQGEPKYLNSPETPIYHKSQEIYGLYEALQNHRKLEKFILVEGYMDVIALAQHGVNYCGASLGTAFTQQHLQKIFRHTDHIIFCFDGDNAGRQAAWRACEIALSIMRDGVNVSFMFLPGSEDPDSFVRSQGRDKFIALANNAIPIVDYFINDIVNQTDIKSINGKAKFAELVRQYLHHMPNGVFKELLMQRVNKIVGTDVEQLSRKQPRPIKPVNIKKLSPIRQAIALVVQFPKLVNSVNAEDLSAVQIPGNDLLKNIITVGLSQPNITTASLIENFRDTKYFNLINQLASQDFMIPQHGIEQEFKDTITKLQQASQKQLIEALLVKASQQELTPNEKQTLQKLIKEK